MAHMNKVVEVCNRCAFGQEKDATTTRRFSVDGNGYILKLCEPHGQMFDRDMIGWERLATDDEYYTAVRVQRSQAFFTPQEREAQRQTALLREQQQHQDEEVKRLSAQREREQQEWNARVEEVKAVQLARPNPLLDKWSVTDHTLVRMAERDYELEDVLNCAEHPMQTYPSKSDPSARIHRRGNSFVVVVPARNVVITVLPKDVQLDQLTQLERIAL